MFSAHSIMASGISENPIQNTILHWKGLFKIEMQEVIFGSAESVKLLIAHGHKAHNLSLYLTLQIKKLKVIFNFFFM